MKNIALTREEAIELEMIVSSEIDRLNDLLYEHEDFVRTDTSMCKAQLERAEAYGRSFRAKLDALRKIYFSLTDDERNGYDV